MRNHFAVARLWSVRQFSVKAFSLFSVAPIKPKGFVALALALSLGCCISVRAQDRFVPTDTAVLLEVSTPSGRAERLALRESISQWRANPSDPKLSTQAARLAFLAAMNEGDPRWLGNAQAMLKPWWSLSEVSADTLFVRALIRQGLHDFDAALLDLDAAVTKDPGRAEFWAWRFAIHMVRADISRAREACRAIGQRFGAAEMDSCDSVLLYRTGNANEAKRKLDALVGHPDYQGRYAREWLTFHRGEVRRVMGEPKGAREIWESYLKAGGSSHVIRLALIELLNEQKDFKAAWSNNDKPPRSDALLVQAIQTSRELGNGQESLLDQEFAQRIKNQKDRGDFINERPIIQYWLYKGDFQKALEMAQQAWKTQQEPADALLYARAALKAGAPKSAEALIKWQSEVGYREAQWDAALTSLKAALLREVRK